LVRFSSLAYADGVSEAIANELKRFFEETAPTGVASAYLFGSHSEARSHRESDVDVAVLLDRRVFGTNRERFEERLRLISAVGSALGRNDVDLVILNDAPPEFGARIVTAGLRVFCSDVEVDHAFLRDVQLRAADLAPFLRRMRALKLEAIKR
jgi:predicted nucleotidyltransferase